MGHVMLLAKTNNEPISELHQYGRGCRTFYSLGVRFAIPVVSGAYIQLTFRIYNADS
jgi:hypothetical protein